VRWIILGQLISFRSNQSSLTLNGG